MAIKHIIRTKDCGTEEVSLTPVRAIRKFCVECMGFSVYEIPRCTSPLCPLYPFRMGKNPSCAARKPPANTQGRGIDVKRQLAAISKGCG